MTKQELVSARHEYRRAVKRLPPLLFIAMGVVVGVCLVGICLESICGETSPSISAVIVICSLLGVLAPVVVAALRQNRLAKRLNVKCPHCATPLLGFSGEIVVASGTCGTCGERVVD